LRLKTERAKWGEDGTAREAVHHRRQPAKGKNPMIARNEMFEPLLEALPGFRPQWEAFIAEWTPKPGRYSELAPGEYPYYLLLARLADHLADLIEKDAPDDVGKALAVCERWLVEGDHYVKEAATVGLLEDLQNVTQRRGIPETRFTALLGPEGKFWWDKVNAFWSKGEGLVDERALSPERRQHWTADVTIGKILWDQGRKPRG
jgi:hypothetical protein